MASCWCLSAVSPPVAASTSETQKNLSFGRRPGVVDARVSVFPNPARQRMRSGVVCMAPDEEKITRRSPLDFPIEWERPKPGRRPDIFPKFSPMKTPLPTPLPADPPEEDDEFEEKEEEEEDPEQEEEEESDKPQGV